MTGTERRKDGKEKYFTLGWGSPFVSLTTTTSFTESTIAQA
jgi:hypothetical protein